MESVWTHWNTNTDTHTQNTPTHRRAHTSLPQYTKQQMTINATSHNPFLPAVVLLSPTHTAQLEGILLFWYLTKCDLTHKPLPSPTPNQKWNTHTDTRTHTYRLPLSLSHTHRWIQISPCHMRYTVRPQWALSLNHKIHYLFHFVIGHKGPNQRSMPHSEWINNGSNENWQMGMIVIM